MKENNIGRSAYIDVLKAFAIIAVVLYHSGFLTYGYLGVDLFLVIGGYLITKSLSKRIFSDDKPSGGYINFELSRIARLLPLLLVAGLSCMVFGFFVMLPDDYENLSQSVIATNVFANNILAAITTKDYWAITNEYRPLMHTWYVGIVMQFYIVYPLLFYMAKLDKINTRRTLLTLLSCLAVISLLIYFGISDDTKRFYMLPARFFEFAVGGIVALVYKPLENKLFRPAFAYCCYALLLALFVVNKELVPSNVRLILVVSISCILIMSADSLSNKITGNIIFSKIGAASYSIFVWHQILLAFYRYTVAIHFTIGTYLLYLIATGLLSYLSYRFIEQSTTVVLQNSKHRRVFWMIVGCVFLITSTFAIYIYKVAGIVRDIPEMYVSTKDRHRNIQAEFCDRGYLYDKPFETEKRHWLVYGNSFGRDFVNILLESPIADSIEISYINDYKKIENIERFAKADRVFISTLGLSEEIVEDIDKICHDKGLLPSQLVIVGEKNFGSVNSNGQIYIKRHRPDYFNQYIPVEDYEQFVVRNKYYSELYEGRFLNLMAFVCNEKGEVRVFTDDCHFISGDNHHLTIGGAQFFGNRIDWTKYL